jgi:hypothetical protein
VEPLTLKLLLGGDLMLGRGIDQQMPQHCDPTLHEAVVRDARHYAQLAEQSQGHDWRLERQRSSAAALAPQPHATPLSHP